MEAPRVAPLVTSPIAASPSKLSRDRPSKTKAVSDLDAKEKAAAAARLRAARVKKPALTSLTSLTVNGDFRAYARSKALSWAFNTDNTEELKSQAAERITAMENKPGDATSAVFKDKNGVTLACVFARRSLNAMKIHGAYPGTVGRTLEHFSESARNEDNYDGLNESLIRRTWEATQTLHSVVQPITPERDVRHNDEKYMVYIPSGNTPEKSERAGVTHLVHCWTMQGHSKGPFMPQSDFLRGCQAALAVKHYYRATQEVAIISAACSRLRTQSTMPDTRQAFKSWRLETADPGPWIGKAIVYKTSRYRSTLMGWMMTNGFLLRRGTSTGGAMYLPDIGMKVSYQPGDILYSCQDSYTTAVGKWSPSSRNQPRGNHAGKNQSCILFPSKFHRSA
ncbi:hypothetical protein B0H14DRAFT_3892267 [Mycena olivaceomarginata]|nr:hypothetical protein B0H14DRAFT_3892267 [Mycena olivaceomarginata]